MWCWYFINDSRSLQNLSCVAFSLFLTFQALHVGSAARYHFLACSFFFLSSLFLVSRLFEEVAQRQRGVQRWKLDLTTYWLYDQSQIVMKFKYLRDQLSMKKIQRDRLFRDFLDQIQYNALKVLRELRACVNSSFIYFSLVL